MGRTIHRNDMQPDPALWARCVSRWGRGSGYRADVVDFHQDWFESQRPALELKVNTLIGRDWGRLMNRISELLAFE